MNGGIYLAYFMTLFLIDLYKMENTCVCLIIIKIEPNFRFLFYHESIIKTFCSREQSTSQASAHSHLHWIKKKKKKQWKLQNCEILSRFWETFCGIFKGVCVVLFCFFVNFFFFFSILSACSITGLVGRSMLSCYHGVQGKDSFYLTPRRPFKYSDDGEF